MASSLVGVAKRALVTVLLSMAAANVLGENLKNPHRCDKSCWFSYELFEQFFVQGVWESRSPIPLDS